MSVNQFVTDEGERVPYKTVKSIDSEGNNCIFIIRTEFKFKEKKNIKELLEKEPDKYINTFLKSKLGWTFDCDVVFDETRCSFFVNTKNMEGLIGNIIPTKCFSIQFTEKYIFHFDINKYIKIKYEDAVEEKDTTNENQTVPTSDDFPKFGNSPVRQPYPNYGSLTFKQQITPPKSPTREFCNSNVNKDNTFRHAIFQKFVTDGKEKTQQIPETHLDRALTVLQKKQQTILTLEQKLKQQEQLIEQLQQQQQPQPQPQPQPQQQPQPQPQQQPQQQQQQQPQPQQQPQQQPQPQPQPQQQSWQQQQQQQQLWLQQQQQLWLQQQQQLWLQQQQQLWLQQQSEEERITRKFRKKLEKSYKQYIYFNQIYEKNLYYMVPLTKLNKTYLGGTKY